mmetsp:Transcript_24994/g.46086  ORF Transcript_24994/g.46086 Transcript_24994/m.46086 type:complete len:277 (-) Transcript_24994:277-1107(-)
MGDRVDLAQRKERNLVVEVVRAPTKANQSGKGLSGEGTTRDGGLEGGDECGTLDGEHHRDEDDGRHGSEDGVEVLGIKVLSDLFSTHGFLGEDTAEGGGDVGKHGRAEGEHGEGKFFHGGDGDSSDDGEEGCVDLHGEDLAQKEGVGTACHHRLGSLDDVGERHGAGTQGNHGPDVHAGMAEGNGKQRLQIIHTKLGCFAESSEPEGDEVENTGGHLDGGDGPWKGEGVECLLVVDVVTDVEEVPEAEVRGYLERFAHVGFRGFFFSDGSARGRES